MSPAPRKPAAKKPAATKPSEPKAAAKTDEGTKPPASKAPDFDKLGVAPPKPDEAKGSPTGAPTPEETAAATEAAKDLGLEQTQDAFAEAQEQGFFGTKVDPLPNAAHSLETGPKAPTAEEQRQALAEAGKETT